MLKVQSLGFQRAGTWLFRRLSFGVMSSCMGWFRGQKGTGKRSLLRLALGLAQTDNGVAQWREVCTTGDKANANDVGHRYSRKMELSALGLRPFLRVLGAPFVAFDDEGVSACNALRISI